MIGRRPVQNADRNDAAWQTHSAYAHMSGAHGARRNIWIRHPPTNVLAGQQAPMGMLSFYLLLIKNSPSMQAAKPKICLTPSVSLYPNTPTKTRITASAIFATMDSTDTFHPARYA